MNKKEIISKKIKEVIINTNYRMNVNDVNMELIKSLTKCHEIYQELKTCSIPKKYNLDVDNIMLKSIKKLIMKKYYNINIQEVIIFMDSLFYYEDNPEIWENVKNNTDAENLSVKYIVENYICNNCKI